LVGRELCLLYFNRRAIAWMVYHDAPRGSASLNSFFSFKNKDYCYSLGGEDALELVQGRGVRGGGLAHRRQDLVERRHLEIFRPFSLAKQDARPAFVTPFENWLGNRLYVQNPCG
jgi:hypothetical protein